MQGWDIQVFVIVHFVSNRLQVVEGRQGLECPSNAANLDGPVLLDLDDALAREDRGLVVIELYPGILISGGDNDGVVLGELEHDHLDVLSALSGSRKEPHAREQLNIWVSLTGVAAEPPETALREARRHAPGNIA